MATTIGIASMAGADSLKWLPSEIEDMQARVDLIEQAQTEIVAEYYDIGGDHVPLRDLALLREAAQRGVNVRIIIDALESSVPKEILAVLIGDSRDKAGIQRLKIRLFNPFDLTADIAHPTRIAGLTHRDHTKLFIADRKVMVIGGRNLTCEYFNECLKQLSFVDLDAMVTGSIVERAQSENFDRLWVNTKAVRPVQYGWVSRPGTASLKKAASILDGHLRNFRASKLSIRSHTSTDWVSKMTPFENAQFLFDDPTQDPTVMSFKFKFQAITQDFLQVLATARESIVIQTPYLFPSDETKLLLASLIRDRGVKIKIITNSILTTNNLLAEVGYKSVRHELIQMGIELYEYKGPQTAHAKAALIDGKIFFIGSFNLDYRSALLNREVALVGESVAVAQELNTIITQRLWGETDTRWVTIPFGTPTLE